MFGSPSWTTDLFRPIFWCLSANIYCHQMACLILQWLCLQPITCLHSVPLDTANTLNYHVTQLPCCFQHHWSFPPDNTGVYLILTCHLSDCVTVIRPIQMPYLPIKSTSLLQSPGNLAFVVTIFHIPAINHTCTFLPSADMENCISLWISSSPAVHWFLEGQRHTV